MKRFFSLIIIFFFITFANSQVVIDSNNCEKNDGRNNINEILNDFIFSNDSLLTNYQIIDNPINLNRTIDFLNKDFKTSIFNNFCYISETNFNLVNNNGKIHFGIIEIKFKYDHDITAIRTIINNTKRNNFKLVVLTQFIVFEKNNSIIFIFSETPDQKIINSFLKRNSIDKL